LPGAGLGCCTTALRSSADLPWAPESPGFDLKVLHGKIDEDARALLLRLEPGTVVGLHRHSDEVHGFKTVRGSIETLDKRGNVTSRTTTSTIAEGYRRFVDNHRGKGQ
jgi:hypothetical protein